MSCGDIPFLKKCDTQTDTQTYRQTHRHTDGGVYRVAPHLKISLRPEGFVTLIAKKSNRNIGEKKDNKTGSLRSNSRLVLVWI